MYAAQVSIDQEQEEQSLLYQAEVLLVLNDLADEGDEKAALFIQQASEELPPESTQLATELNAWRAPVSKKERTDVLERRCALPPVLISIPMFSRRSAVWG